MTYTSTKHPHVPAAFINTIREEGTKKEACDFLQAQWNETFALSAQLTDLQKERDELAAAIDSIETSNGLTDNGNLWRFWSKQAREIAGKLVAANERHKADLDAAVLAETERCGAIAESHNYGFQSTTDADLRASHIAAEIRKGEPT